MTYTKIPRLFIFNYLECFFSSVCERPHFLSHTSFVSHASAHPPSVCPDLRTEICCVSILLLQPVQREQVKQPSQVDGGQRHTQFPSRRHISVDPELIHTLQFSHAYGKRSMGSDVWDGGRDERQTKSHRPCVRPLRLRWRRRPR